MQWSSFQIHFSRGALGDIFLACSPALWVSGCPIQSFIILNFRSSPAGIHTHFVDPGAGLPTADSRLPTIPCPPHYSPFSACSPPIARPRCRPTCWWSVFCVLDVDAVAMCSWDAGPLGSRIFWGSRLSLGGNGVVRRREWGWIQNYTVCTLGIPQLLNCWIFENAQNILVCVFPIGRVQQNNRYLIIDGIITIVLLNAHDN